MDSKKYLSNEEKLNVLQEDAEDGYWKAAEEKEIKESLQLSHTERFRIMMRLMRIDMMLRNAKVTHKKFPG